MDPKGILKALALELRHELEGRYDDQVKLQPGDLERRLAAIGVRRDRASVPLDELPHLPAEDCEARRVVDAFLESRVEAGQNREEAVAQFVREAAYTWANRLLALRCMEARGLTDEIVLQKEAYGGRSLQHHRLARKEPERCAGEDEGLFAALFDEFERRAAELPLLFNPRAPEVALRPPVASLKRCIALLSGTEAVKGQQRATDEAFTAPDALGWTYQYWNTEEKDRVFEKVRTKKGAKIEGAEIIPATCMYTEPYMVKFLVQNSLGAIWMGMHPESRLCGGWEYYVRDADRTPVPRKPVREITFLDPACGSGHFLIEAFDLFYGMYVEEGRVTDPADICSSILEQNLYGIDIDERAVQIAALALYMKAKEKAADFVPRRVNLVATNIRLPAGKEQLETFLRKHPEDAPLKPALLTIFDGLAHADELGSLLQIEQPVERELRHLRERQVEREDRVAAGSLFGPRGEEGWEAWKRGAIERLRSHFEAETITSDLAGAFFGQAASKGLSLEELLSHRYDVVAANPPYMHCSNFGSVLKSYIYSQYPQASQDLYAAFTVRIAELSKPSGWAAIVTQQSFMFLERHLHLRQYLFAHTSPELVVHLGPHAFAEIGGEVVNVVLMTLRRAPDLYKVGIFWDLTAVVDKGDSLRRTRPEAGTSQGAWNRKWSDFAQLPGCPIAYYFPEPIVQQFSGPLLDQEASVPAGMVTGNNSRFVRFWWERLAHVTPYMKGGLNTPWYGNNLFVIDASPQGFARMRASRTFRAAGSELYGRPGITYSSVSTNMRARFMDSGAIWDCGGPVIIPHNEGDTLWLLALINSTYAQKLLYGLNPTINIKTNDVKRVPTLPKRIRPRVTAFAEIGIALARRLDSSDPSSRRFEPAYSSTPGVSLRQALVTSTDREELIHCLLSLVQELIDSEIVTEFRLASGIGKGFMRSFHVLPRLSEFARLSVATSADPEILRLASPLIQADGNRNVRVESLADVTPQVHRLYEAAGTFEPELENIVESSGDDEQAVVEPLTKLSSPDNVFEEVAGRAGIHPLSTFMLVRRGRDTEGWRCVPSERRHLFQRLTVVVLSLLGHRWPVQIEDGEPAPEWGDRDGIIPISEGTEESTLLLRVRDRIAADFGADRVSVIEREFQEIMGEPLAQWLAGSFFTRHISQFKKRPIAWQIQSQPAGNGKRGKRSSRRRAPVFSCLVYYHRLDADLLPTLRTQYVGPLRSRLQTELNGLEKLTSRTADQDARRFELEESLDELKAFDTQLEKVIVGGFVCEALDKHAAREPLDRWTSRDGSAPAPASPDAFLAQERKYDPDLNDGVRVNIAPLQHAGLLAADVLAARDLDKAIADRAEWRADERRWCREGKLPRPGWWPAL